MSKERTFCIAVTPEEKQALESKRIIFWLQGEIRKTKCYLEECGSRGNRNEESFSAGELKAYWKVLKYLEHE